MMVGLCYWFCLNRKYGFLFGGFVPEKKEETQNKKQKKNSGTFKQVQHCHFLHFNKEGGSSVYKRKEKKKGGGSVTHKHLAETTTAPNGATIPLNSLLASTWSMIPDWCFTGGDADERIRGEKKGRGERR